MAAAEAETGLNDYGSDSFRPGLEHLTEALRSEAQLNELGSDIMRMRLVGHLASRLQVHDTVKRFPQIEDRAIRAPLFIIGLPRTGTTALSNLLDADPAIRSLRCWESSSPVPPPEAATQDTDPRIAPTARGLEAMYETFPKMRSLHFQTATGPTECQDLLGMDMRTSHFDGMAIVPSYTRWVLECDMTPAYVVHRRTLQLLQWHCPPYQWHLKTPVHMLSLPALVSVYPDARFIWTHRDPSEVMGSVCSLIDIHAQLGERPGRPGHRRRADRHLGRGPPPGHGLSPRAGRGTLRRCGFRRVQPGPGGLGGLELRAPRPSFRRVEPTGHAGLGLPTPPGGGRHPRVHPR